MKISHQKGRKNLVIGPKPLFNHTRWCGLGKHAKKALEGGGSCAHLLATHPREGRGVENRAILKVSNPRYSEQPTGVPLGVVPTSVRGPHSGPLGCKPGPLAISMAMYGLHNPLFLPPLANPPPKLVQECISINELAEHYADDMKSGFIKDKVSFLGQQHIGFYPIAKDANSFWRAAFFCGDYRCYQ